MTTTTIKDAKHPEEGLFKPNRLRWDFRNGRYYYLVKTAEAARMGHHMPAGTSHVRIYWGLTRGPDRHLQVVTGVMDCA